MNYKFVYPLSYGAINELAENGIITDESAEALHTKAQIDAEALGLLDDSETWVCIERDSMGRVVGNYRYSHYQALDCFIYKGWVDFIQFDNDNFGLFRDDDKHVLEFHHRVPSVDRETIKDIVHHNLWEMFRELCGMYGVDGDVWDYYADPCTVYDDIANTLTDQITNTLENMA